MLAKIITHVRKWWIYKKKRTHRCH